MSLLNEENSLIEQEISINYPIDFYLVEASKNKNFSKCNFQSTMLYENDEEKKKKEDEILEDQLFLSEIQKDYETYLSKDVDLEKTLGRMVSVTSITSVNDDFQIKNNLISNNKYAESKADKMEKRKKKASFSSPFLQSHPFRNLIFSPYINDMSFKKHLMIVYKGLVYSKKFLKVHISEYKREKSINLKASEGPRYKTLFLDLDETLIHTCAITENPDHIIKGKDDSGGEILIGFNVRPYCLEFLKKLSHFYEIVIFTASVWSYANAIISFLDPFNQYIKEILTRSVCVKSKNGFFIKDLRIIKNRELKNMILVDNLSHSFGFQIDNGVPILEFIDDKKDKELKYLYDHLLEALYVDDIRVFNRKKLKLYQLSEMNMEELKL